MKESRLLAPLVAACLGACGGDGDGAGGAAASGGAGGAGGRPAIDSQPPGWDEAVRLVPAEDLDPDPHVLEVELVARATDLPIVEGTTTHAWTYGGAIPGPLLELTAGDRLVVRFRNELPEPTTIHWHGLRVPADQDGAPHAEVAPIEPGGTFEYAFDVPDAGLYWYHPHVDSAAQVGAGLYGAIVVRPAPESPPEPEGLGDELLLVMSDIGVEEDGSLRDPHAGGDLGMLFGREGDVVLVNGVENPRVLARPGLRQRWRIVNAARSRYLQLELPSHRFTRIGGDGGLLEAPIEEERLVLTPGQRVDVVVTLDGEPGASLPLRWVPIDRGYGSVEFRESVDVMTVSFEGERAEPSPLPTIARAIAAPEVDGATPVEIALTQGKGPDGGVVLGIDGVPSWEAEPLVVHLGERQLWTVRNDMDWDHPFHLHGFFFHEVDAGGALVERREHRDTINVPRRESRRFVVAFDERPGMWMFHCHILDHADAGMMGMIHLMP